MKKYQISNAIANNLKGNFFLFLLFIIIQIFKLLLYILQLLVGDGKYYLTGFTQDQMNMLEKMKHFIGNGYIFFSFAEIFILLLAIITVYKTGKLILKLI